MKPLQVLPLALCYLVFCGCSAEAREQEKTAPASQPTKKTGMLDSSLFDHFGEGATEGKALSPADLVANLSSYEGKRVRLKGTVSAVCKNKGCWMYVGEGESRVKVRFKDYGFFVPRDCEGRTAILEGEASLYTMSVAERKHYLEDEGKLEEAAKVTEPKKVPFVMADGVALAKVAAKK